MALINPVHCIVDVKEGLLKGTERRYKKTFADLSGLYADEEAFRQLASELGERVVYEVTDYHPGSRCQDLIFGVTCMVPGKVGNEYFMTRGHIHGIADRPEIYVGKKGRGLMLMESPEGETRVIEIGQDDICYVPPFWIHRSVNTGNEDFVMLFCYPADSGQDYGIIARSNGMKHRVVDDGKGGWVLEENPAYQPRDTETVNALFGEDG
ncbi:glucose-6-phosphate isomerase [Parasalinivibrio latis]|uniref:glucose-6-phosphate isomerase n=1 Tax=Parasalinivibrio latis TaxID=2952610 RepID=UPI0030E1F4F0